jgi:predicted GNAT family acetyltransferase
MSQHTDQESDSQVIVADVPERSRYEITVDGTLAGFADYRPRPDRLVITHSEIADAYQGRGLAGRLTGAALDDIRAKGLLVTPLCPYTASYIRKHPEYADLVDEKHRATAS